MPTFFIKFANVGRYLYKLSIRSSPIDIKDHNILEKMYAIRFSL